MLLGQLIVEPLTHRRTPLWPALSTSRQSLMVPSSLFEANQRSAESNATE